VNEGTRMKLVVAKLKQWTTSVFDFIFKALLLVAVVLAAVVLTLFGVVVFLFQEVL